MAATVTGPNMAKMIQALQRMGFIQSADAKTMKLDKVKDEPRTIPPTLRPRPVGAPSVAALKRTLCMCPNCGLRGRVGKSFGVRNMGNGTIRPQSWCRDCRADRNNDRAKAFRKLARRG